MVQVCEIRACMARKGITQKELANKLCISEKTMVKKMKDGSFGLEEAKVMIDYLGIKNPAEIFFANKVT